ncbi:hypothetical protein AAY473_009248 [Plecturocebus cupreus]
MNHGRVGNLALTLAEAGISPEVRSSRPAQPTWGNLVSIKNTKISQKQWHTPVIPSTPEDVAAELLEPGRQRFHKEPLQNVEGEELSSAPFSHCQPLPKEARPGCDWRRENAPECPLIEKQQGTEVLGVRTREIACPPRDPEESREVGRSSILETQADREIPGREDTRVASATLLASAALPGAEYTGRTGSAGPIPTRKTAIGSTED